MDIVVADVPETYGMWISGDWSEKMKGYFSTYWSHLWIPYNGRPNHIKINREPLMKKKITDLNDPSEQTIFVNIVIVGRWFWDNIVAQHHRCCTSSNTQHN